MSIAEKLMEFSASLNEVDNSDKEYYKSMDMADKMAMGMGGLGTLYGSAAEQAGMPVQDWAKKYLTPEAMDATGIALSDTAANWSPEQAAIFEGIQNAGTAATPITPVQVPATTADSGFYGEGVPADYYKDADIRERQLNRHVGMGWDATDNMGPGIPSISSKDLNRAQEQTQDLVQTAVADQVDDVNNTTQAAKETEGWSEEHFRGAIKVIDGLLAQTDPKSAEHMSLQNRKADLIRVYEAQTGNESPYRAMENQIAQNNAAAMAKENELIRLSDAKQMEQAKRQAEATQAYNRYAPEMDHSSNAGEAEAQAINMAKMAEQKRKDDAYNMLVKEMEDSKSPMGEELARTAYLREQRADADYAKQDALDTQRMLAEWDAETEYEQNEQDTAELIANARTGAGDTPDWLGKAQGAPTDTQREQMVKADQANTDKADLELLEKQANDAGFTGPNAIQQYLDADGDPGVEDNILAREEMNDMMGAAEQTQDTMEEDADLEAIADASPTSTAEAVQGVTALKKNVANSKLTPSERAEKLLLEAEKAYTKDPDWGLAMMQFGLTLMSTPGDFLTAVGKAGQVALKTYQDTKSGAYDKGVKKEELALKWANLADARAKELADAKKKQITMYSVGNDGKLVEFIIKRPTTEGEANNARLSNMTDLIMSDKINNLSEADAIKLARSYQGIIGEYIQDNFKTGERTWKSGKEDPTVVYARLAELYPDNKAIRSAADSWKAGSPLGRRKREYAQKLASAKSLLDNVEDYRADIDAMDPKANNWYGTLYTKVIGAVQPFFDSVELDKNTTQDSMESQARTTFEKATGIKLSTGSTDDVDVQHTKMFTMAYGLARQIMKVGYDEHGRALSDKDMDFAMNMIAPGFGATATKDTMKTAIDTAMRSLSNDQFRRYEELFNKGESTSEEMKTLFLQTFEKKHARYMAGLHGKDWADALPAAYKEPSANLNQTGPDVSIYLPTALKYFKQLQASYPGDNSKVIQELGKYLDEQQYDDITRNALIEAIKKEL